MKTLKIVFGMLILTTILSVANSAQAKNICYPEKDESVRVESSNPFESLFKDLFTPEVENENAPGSSSLKIKRRGH